MNPNAVSPTTVNTNHHSLMLSTFKGLEVGPLKDGPPHTHVVEHCHDDDGSTWTLPALVPDTSSSDATDKPATTRRVAHGFQTAPSLTTSTTTTSCPEHGELSSSTITTRVSESSLQTTEATSSSAAANSFSPILKPLVGQPSKVALETAAATAALAQVDSSRVVPPLEVSTSASSPSRKNGKPVEGSLTDRLPQPAPVLPRSAFPPYSAHYHDPQATTSSQTSPYQRYHHQQQSHVVPYLPPPFYYSLRHQAPAGQQLQQSYRAQTMGRVEEAPVVPLDHRDHAKATEIVASQDHRGPLLTTPALSKPPSLVPSLLKIAEERSKPILLKKRGHDAFCPTVRNQRMLPTDCLLFAASLLQENDDNDNDTTSVAPFVHITDRQQAATETLNAKDGKPLQQQSHVNSNTKRTLQTHDQVQRAALSDSSNMSSSRKRKASTDAQPHLVAVLPGSARNRQCYPIQPNHHDVLCGRGGQVNKHMGNQVYRRVVEYNKPFYQTVQKRHRILVSQSIVQSILNRGGRFLSEECRGGPDGATITSWTEIDVRRAVQKTSQALRERSNANGGTLSIDRSGETSGEEESTCETAGSKKASIGSAPFPAQQVAGGN